MNILHISPYLPSTDENHAGGICMGKQVETLKREHTVHVLSFVVTDKDAEIAKTLNEKFYTLHSLSKLQRIIRVISHFWMPNLFAARSSRKFTKDLFRLIEELKIDAIHAEYAAMGQYLKVKKKYPNIIFNLVEHDVTAQAYERKIINEKSFFKRIYLKIQLILIYHYEKKYCMHADNVFVFNEKDKHLVQILYKKKEVEVINPYYGIDCDKMTAHHLSTSNAICFIGQMGRKENSDAAIRLIHIAHEIKKQISDLEVYIIGNAPTPELFAFRNEYIHVTGYVNNIEPAITACRLAVFPLNAGAGIKLKVLLSLALGVPVITTLIGAEGIDETGEVLQLATTDEDFKNKIIFMLQNPEFCEQLSKKGLAFVKHQFSWQKTEIVFSNVYNNKKEKFK